MSNLSTDNIIEDLDRVKATVDMDPSFYPQILNGILDVALREDDRLRLRCSNLFINAMTSEGVDDSFKQFFSLKLLDPVVSMLESAADPHLQINCIMLGAIVYRDDFEYVAKHPSNGHMWNQLEKLKSKTFALWNESSHFGVVAECIKFAQQVIVTQTPNSSHRDPRLQERQPLQSGRDFSLSDVPRDHPLITFSLDAEAQGLLDRVLSVFSGPTFHSQIVTATIFALSAIMKVRPPLVNKIMPIVLHFEVWNKKPDARSSEEASLQRRFVEKVLKLFFQHSIKTVGGRFANQVHSYLGFLANSQRSGEKRPATSQLTKKDPRRAKIEQQQGVQSLPPTPQQPQQQPQQQQQLPPKPRPVFPPNLSTEVPPLNQPYSFKNLYTLIEPENPLGNIDATQFPLQLAINLTVATLATANPEVYNKCIDVVKQRYENFTQQVLKANRSGFNDNINTNNNNSNGNGNNNKRGFKMQNKNFVDDDLLSAPDENGQISAAEIAAEAANNNYDDDDSDGGVGRRRKSGPMEELDDEEDDEDEQMGEASLSAAGGFSLPEPAPLTTSEKVKTLDNIVVRMIASESATLSGEGGTSSLSITNGNSDGEDENKGLNRVAFTEWGRSSWVALLSRLLTRGLGQVASTEKLELQSSARDQQVLRARLQHQIKGVERMAKQIREMLLKYCLERFWERLDIVLEWLNEEWYHEFVRLDPSLRPASKDAEHSVYFEYVSRMMENIIPRVEVSNRKDFMRLLSDLPEFNKEIIWRLKSLCIDPVRFKLGFMSLIYLVKFKPPSKEHSLDLVEELYASDKETRNKMATNLLQQYRPEFLQAHPNE